MSNLDDFFRDVPEQLSVKDVAQLLGVSSQAVYSWLNDGVFPGYRIGKTWFILREDLKATMRAGRNMPEE